MSGRVVYGTASIWPDAATPKPHGLMKRACVQSVEAHIYIQARPRFVWASRARTVNGKLFTHSSPFRVGSKPRNKVTRFMLVYVWNKRSLLGSKWKRDVRSGFRQENRRCVAASIQWWAAIDTEHCQFAPNMNTVASYYTALISSTECIVLIRVSLALNGVAGKLTVYTVLGSTVANVSSCALELKARKRGWIMALFAVLCGISA